MIIELTGCSFFGDRLRQDSVWLRWL